MQYVNSVHESTTLMCDGFRKHYPMGYTMLVSEHIHS